MHNLPNTFLTKYFIIAVLALGSTPVFSQVSISINIAPPPLQVYDQPACPDDGYIWTPGYWAYGDNAYYWVPGAWVQSPEIGDLWTPPYWGWDGGAYVFYPGYWGQTVGYYGGINYGYGYGGHGYGGGRWQGGHFSYNTAVNNVNSTNIHNTYVDRTAINKKTSKVSYNGGKGGVQAQPTAQERTTHPTSVQQAPVRTASQVQPNPANTPFTGEPVKPAVTPQPQEVNSQPATIFHPQPQAQQEASQQQETQAKPETHLQPQAQTQPPVHEQQTQPKQESHPQQTQQPPPDKKSAAQPDNKPDNAPKNTPGH
jgi:hypothetical protein